MGRMGLSKLVESCAATFVLRDYSMDSNSDAEARRLINEIVLDEESDELPNGSFASHFELYYVVWRSQGLTQAQWFE